TEGVQSLPAYRRPRDCLTRGMGIRWDVKRRDRVVAEAWGFLLSAAPGVAGRRPDRDGNTRSGSLPMASLGQRRRVFRRRPCPGAPERGYATLRGPEPEDASTIEAALNRARAHATRRSPANSGAAMIRDQRGST